MPLPEAVPHLTERCCPPAILGTAKLATLATQGADAAMLAATIADAGPGPAALHYDTSIAWQLGFRRGEALALQAAAVALSPLFRVRGPGGPAALRVLALFAVGDLMANAPLDFLTSHLDVRLDLLFLQPDRALPAELPDHDVLFVAIADADEAVLERLHSLLAGWPRPVVNDPAGLPALDRERLAQRLAGRPGLCSPPTVAVDRAALDVVARGGGAIAGLLPGGRYPVLLRPLGSHAGAGLCKIDSAADLSAALLLSTARTFYITAYVDYRSADGLFRKYRIAFIGGAPHLCHMATSQHWMVHYLNAGMMESADRRAQEADAMAGFETGFARRHAAGFAQLHQVLPFDYYSIDCGEMPDGRLLVFEADTAAIIHLMDPVEVFPYKHPHMRRVFDAFDALLRGRADCREPLAKSWSPKLGNVR